MMISNSKLCKGLPKEIKSIVSHCKSLKFKEEPNYSLLQDIIVKIGEIEGFDLND